MVLSDNKFDFSIVHSIDASPDIVYQVLADLESYPEFINDLVSVKREGELYHFVARAALLTIPASLKVTKTPGRSVAFELVEGPVDLLSGRWLIEAGDAPGQTRVTLTIQAEAGQRGEWLLRMTAKFVENKAGKLIAAFSNRVIELERSGEAPPPSLPATTRSGGFMAWLKRLWGRIFGQPALPQATREISSARPGSKQALTKPAGLFRDEHQRQTLEALATTMLPPDDFDQGAPELGFVNVVELRARYEAGRAELYTAGIEAVDSLAQSMYGKSSFVDLIPSERAALLDAIRQNRINGDMWGQQIEPSSFFSALWEDVSFVYCTHPHTWQRIGFPGPSFDSGGYRDFDQPQEFMGKLDIL